MKAVNRVFGKKSAILANSDTPATSAAKEAAAPAPAADDDDDDDDLFGDADEGDQKPQLDVTVKQDNNEVPAASPGPALVSPPAGTPPQSGQTAASGEVPTLQPPPISETVPDGVPMPGQEATASSNTQTIPRKHHNVPDAAKNAQSNSNLGSKYSLPPGVKIPRSVEEKGLLHGKILEALRKIPVELMNESLTEYDDAVQIKGESIRNHAAYLFGVIKRYVDVQETRGEALVQASLAPSVQRKLDDLVRSGYCTKGEMDEKVRGKIRMLSERDALIALDELSSVDRSQIRNFGSYLMGIIVKRHRSSTGGGGGSSGGATGSGDHGRDSNRSDSRSRRRDSGDDRNYRGSTKKDSYGRHDRERSRDRSDDRSRDDRDRRNEQYRRDTDRDRSHYGPSQSNQGYHGQPPMGASMQGQTQQMPPSMNSFSQQAQPPYVQPPTQYGMPVNHQQPQQFVPQMGSMPAPISQHNQNYPLQNQGYPPSQNQTYPPQSRSGSGQPIQNMMMQPMMGPGQPPMQPPYSQHQQPAYSLNQPINQMMNQNPQQQQTPYIQHNQLGGHPLHPQLPRGADSYGSAQQPNSGGWQQQQVAGPYGSHQGQGQGSGWQQPNQQPGQIPLDILGLADKAASAVQQLTGQNKGLGGPQPSYLGHPAPQYSSVPPPGSNMMQQCPPGPGMPYSNGPNPSIPPYNVAMTGNSNHQQSNSDHLNSYQQQGGGANRANPRKGRATTTATLSDLPVMVQYAVNNLQATRQVDHELDGGILGMIKDLPEPLALAALQKFTSCDKNAMRNKTAYLAGVLRRELERINRR